MTEEGDPSDSSDLGVVPTAGELAVSEEGEVTMERPSWRERRDGGRRPLRGREVGVLNGLEAAAVAEERGGVGSDAAVASLGARRERVESGGEWDRMGVEGLCGVGGEDGAARWRVRSEVTGEFVGTTAPGYDKAGGPLRSSPESLSLEDESESEGELLVVVVVVVGLEPARPPPTPPLSSDEARPRPVVDIIPSSSSSTASAALFNSVPV